MSPGERSGVEQKAGVGGGTAMAEGRGRRRGEGTSCVHFKEVFLFFLFARMKRRFSWMCIMAGGEAL